MAMYWTLDSHAGPIVTHIRAERVWIDRSRFLFTYVTRSSDGLERPLSPEDATKNFGPLLAQARRVTPRLVEVVG